MNVTRLTEQYLNGYPSIRDCIKNRLVNYSKLARRVIKENGLKPQDFDAVLIACRRYYYKLATREITEENIIALLGASKIEIKNRIAVVVLGKDVFSEDLIELEKKAKKRHEVFYAIEGSRAITLILSSDFVEDVKVRFRDSIIKTWQDLAIVVVRSSEGIQDTTPGFMAFLAGKISERGINILEFMSCWSETLFVVAESDSAGVMGALKI